MARETATKRAERKPLFKRGPQSVNGDKDPNFEYRFVNDKGSRLSNMLEGGYELVQDEALIVGDSRVNGPSDLGSAKRVISDDGTVSYLMRIKKEWYNEDQAHKEAQNAELEKAMQTEATSAADYGKFNIS